MNTRTQIALFDMRKAVAMIEHYSRISGLFTHDISRYLADYDDAKAIAEQEFAVDTRVPFSLVRWDAGERRVSFRDESLGAPAVSQRSITGDLRVAYSGEVYDYRPDGICANAGCTSPRFDLMMSAASL